MFNSDPMYKNEFIYSRPQLDTRTNYSQYPYENLKDIKLFNLQPFKNLSIINHYGSSKNFSNFYNEYAKVKIGDLFNNTSLAKISNHSLSIYHELVKNLHVKYTTYSYRMRIPIHWKYIMTIMELLYFIHSGVSYLRSCGVHQQVYDPYILSEFINDYEYNDIDYKPYFYMFELLQQKHYINFFFEINIFANSEDINKNSNDFHNEFASENAKQFKKRLLQITEFIGIKHSYMMFYYLIVRLDTIIKK